MRRPGGRWPWPAAANRALGDAGAGLALGLIRAVDVLDLGEGFRLGQCGGQLGRHRALLGDGGRDLILALIEAAEVFEAVSKVTQDLVIHRARGFLTVAGDKRDRIAWSISSIAPCTFLTFKFSSCASCSAWFGMVFPFSVRLKYERHPPGNSLSFGSKRKLAKKTAAVSTQRTRDLGAARPQDPQSGSRKGRGLNESSIYFSFLTPPPLPPPLSRVFPRTPDVFNGSSVGAAYMPPATYRGNPSTGKGAGCRPPLPLPCVNFHSSL